MTARVGYVINGVLGKGDRIEIGFDEPFFAHGFGLFETIRIHRGRPCFLRPHIERMKQSADELGLDFRQDEETIRDQIAELLDSIAIKDARVKLHLLGREDGACDFLVTALEIAALPSTFPPIALGEASSEFNAPSMAGKKTMNYLTNRLAERDGIERGFDEVLFCLADGTLTEGTKSTLFAVIQGKLTTPPLDLPILPGVTRRVFCALAEEIGISVDERRFTWSELLEAEEVFLVSSLSTFRPVDRLGSSVKLQAPGPIGARLIAVYLELVESDGELRGDRPAV